MSSYNNNRNSFNNSNAPPSKPGACYAKSLMPNTYDITLLEYPVYTGNHQTSDGVEVRTLTLKEGGTKWIKKRADRNCLSADPEDCLVWCMVEYPAKTVTIPIADTSRVETYEWQTFEQKTLHRKGGQTEWVEVLCDKYVTVTLVESIQSVLQEVDKYNGFITGRFDEETRTALKGYQEDNDLPIGNLDFESLDALGVSY